MKRTYIFKTISLVLTASIGAAMASCNVEPDPTTTTSEQPTATTSATTSETTEETTTEATATETEAPTPTPLYTRSYSYTLYEDLYPVSFKMFLNVEDYFTSTEDGEVFELFKLASDLGWLEKGEYTYADYEEAILENPDQKKIGHSNWYTYSYGDHRAVFSVTEYIEDMADYDERQVSMVTFEYIKNDITIPYFDDAASNTAHNKLVINIKRHFEICDYRMGNLSIRCSREDAIAIAYSLWSYSNSPNTNMPVQNTFEIYRDEDWDIVLP